MLSRPFLGAINRGDASILAHAIRPPAEKRGHRRRGRRARRAALLLYTSSKIDGVSGHTPGTNEYPWRIAVENNRVPAIVTRSAKPSFVGSIPTRASKISPSLSTTSDPAD